MKGWIPNRVLKENESSQGESVSNGMKVLTNEMAEKVLRLVWEHLKNFLTFKFNIVQLNYKQAEKNRRTNDEDNDLKLDSLQI